MALRMLEMILPADMRAAAVDVCQGIGALGTWHEALGEDLVLVRVLAQSNQLDQLIAESEKRFGHDPAFRLVVFSIDATLPRLADAKPPVGAAEETPPSRQRIAVAELTETLSGGVGITRTLGLTTVLSTIVATLGLMRNDSTVVIGAMVIAPLLTPNMALSLATTLGDARLARAAFRAALFSLVLAAAVALLLGLLVPFDPSVPEIARRSRVDLSDIFLALASGSAGALAFTTGLPAMLVGVMVAVALMPPLVATVLLAASGLWDLASQAGLLVCTNVICVNLAGVATFLYQDVRPQHWWEAHRARLMVRVAGGIWLALLVVLVVLVYLSGFRAV